MFPIYELIPWQCGPPGAFMKKSKLAERRRASVVVSKMMLTLNRAMMKGYVRRDNIGNIYPEIIVAAAIRAHDARRRGPISIKRIVKRTGLPRTSVNRFLKLLVEYEVVAKSDDGYVACDGFLQARKDAVYFRHMIAAIRAAASLLRDYK